MRLREKERAQESSRTIGIMWKRFGVTRELPKSRFLPWIDDYNHWMGGVDVADQQTLYYHPCKLVCYKNWIPIFIQLLSIIHNNAYIIHHSNMENDALTHKEFTQESVGWCQMPVTQPSKAATDFPNQKYQKRRLQKTAKGRMSHQCCLLFNNLQNNSPPGPRHRKNCMRWQISVLAPVCTAQLNTSSMIKKRQEGLFWKRYKEDIHTLFILYTYVKR